MKITITHHYNIYTLIWSIGKERKTYIQKNNCCIWAQRSDNWIDMYWIQQLLLFVTCIYLYFTCIYLYCLVCMRNVLHCLPLSLVFGRKVTPTPLSNLSLHNLMTLCFFQTSVQRDKMVPYRER